MQSLADDKVRCLKVVACRIVPEVADLDGPGLDAVLAIIDRALLDRQAGVRRQIGVFLGLIRWLPVLRFGATFDRLPAAVQDRVLCWLQSCPVTRLRQGFWGLKVLVFMGYYGRPEAWASIGYAPRVDRAGESHA